MYQTLAIIGASYLQLPLVKRAKKLGLRTICFAWDEGAVCKDLVDKFYPISIVEKDEILSICQKEQIDGICTIASDVAAPTVAYVAEQMGLIGNQYEVALKANNKYLMRQTLTESGILCPQYRCVNTTHTDMLEQLNDLQNNFQLPLIVKPSDRSGSLGVVKVDTWDTLNDAILSAMELSFKHEAMVEEYIDGDEISVEYISYNGVHYPLQITDKVTTGAPHFVELEHHQPTVLPKDVCSNVYKVTHRALIALGITNGASHSEYKITRDGKIYVMEIGARMGGDFIGSDLVQLSTGYDFLQGVINVALGRFEPPQQTFSKCSGVYFASAETKDVFLKLYSMPGMKGELTSNIFKKVTCSADRNGYIIYQSDNKITLN